jgi:hypothetical protein
VKGEKIMGEYPPNLSSGGPLNIQKQTFETVWN